MANLRKGTTVGGYPIITEVEENDHIHHVSEIDGLGSGAQANDGPGSGFDADTLNGNHFSDMRNVWVDASGDTVDASITLRGNLDIAPDNAAVNRAYIKDYIQKNSITQSEAIPYVAVDRNFTVTRSGNVITAKAGDILIGGYFYKYNDLVKNLGSDASIGPNKTYYLYLKVASDNIYLEVDSSNQAYGYYRILVGEVRTDGSGNVTSHTTYPKPSNLGQIIIISDEPRPNAIINANSTITQLDPGWFSLRNGDHVDSISLYGYTEVPSATTVNYTITDYDMLSNYYVRCDAGSLSHYENGITFTPPTVNVDSIVTIYITRNQTTRAFRIKIFA